MFLQLNTLKHKLNHKTQNTEKYLVFDSDDRYEPIKKEDLHGIVLLHDKHPERERKFVEMKATTETSSSKTEEKEAPVPAAFEFDPTKE